MKSTIIDPLGLRADGTPFWSYCGGASEGEGDGDGDNGGNTGDDDGDDGDDDKVGDDGLTASGRKAIEAERAAARRAREQAKKWRELAQDLGVSSPDEIRKMLNQNKGKSDIDATEIARKAREEATSAANKRILRSEIKALAADKFADAGDAVLNLDLGEYEVDENGDVDVKQIEADLNNLLRRKPHLAKERKKVDYEIGARGARRGGAKDDMDDMIRRMGRR